MTQDAVSNQHDQALGLRQELSGLCPVSPWMAGGGFKTSQEILLQGGGRRVDEARRPLSEGGVHQVPIHHRLEQSEDGAAELLGMGLEVVCGRFVILLSVSTAGCKVSIVTSAACRAFPRLLSLESGDRAGFGDIGADQEQGVGSDNIFEGNGPTMGPLTRPVGVGHRFRWPYRALLSTRLVPITWRMNFWNT